MSSDRRTGPTSHIEKEAKPGDHVIVSITGHGGYLCSVTTGTADHITTSNLQPYIDALTKKGIYVHLNVNACKAGEFLNIENASVFALVKGNENFSEHETDLVRKYYEVLPKQGSQLRSYACAQAHDPANIATVGLNAHCDRWETPKNRIARNKLVLEWEDDDPFYGDQRPVKECARKELDDLTRQLNQIRSAIEIVKEAEMRKGLSELFEQEVFSVYKGCLAEAKSTPEYIHFLSKIDSWRIQFEKIKKCNLKEMDYPRIERIRLSLEKIDRRTQFNFDSLEEFLKDADHEQLKECKKHLCSLAYNYKTHTFPKGCNP